MILQASSSDAVFYYLFAGIISLLLLGTTIATAMRVNRRERHNKIIIKLLAAIAEKNNVDSNKLIELIKESEK